MFIFIFTIKSKKALFKSLNYFSQRYNHICSVKNTSFMVHKSFKNRSKS